MDILKDYIAGNGLDNIDSRIDALITSIVGESNLYLASNAFYDAMIGKNVSGSTLELWTQKLAQLVSDDNLMNCYLSLEGYLARLIHYQLIATNLVIEAKNYLYDSPSDPYAPGSVINTVFENKRLQTGKNQI
ncbi:hypothetical protein [Anaeromicropila populeti]|uniref:Uncharacterized protein n=1 Tax=Anaeromicropila populeti TaxID=37658 RepID=A0A1I6INQ5_9FIRM|nr:hypothetical protein [Anaeromicropila populeti]SFR68239.1 hypothetical protein SAMN05661086_00940 [Anaeromicropila populeti]